MYKELKYDWFCYIHMSNISTVKFLGFFTFCIVIFLNFPLSEGWFPGNKVMVVDLSTRDCEYF